MKLFTSVLALASLVLSGCGAVSDIITTKKSPDCVDGLMLSSNCQVGGPAPTPTPAPQQIGLTFQGDVPTPPPSSYTLQGHIQVPQGTPSSWQSLGVNNQPLVNKTVATTMTLVGQCRLVHIKIQVSNGGPNSGTFINNAAPHKFKYCEENGKIAVTFEDGGGPLTDFNDYKILIGTTNNQPLSYQVLGNNQLLVCLD